MSISKYQKIFGVGPLAAILGFLVLGLLWLLDRVLDHVEIVNQPKSLRVIGAILIAAWICWHAWCLKTIKSWWQEDQLCTTGPYRFVRHPIYAGLALLLGFGFSLILNSWLILLWPLLWCCILSMLVRKEEKMMEALFGEEYKRFAARTGRLLPRFFSKII